MPILCLRVSLVSWSMKDCDLEMRLICLVCSASNLWIWVVDSVRASSANMVMGLTSVRYKCTFCDSVTWSARQILLSLSIASLVFLILYVSSVSLDGAGCPMCEPKYLQLVVTIKVVPFIESLDPICFVTFLTLFHVVRL